MIIWAILIITSLSAVLMTATTSVNEKAYSAARAAMKGQRPRLVALLLPFLSLAITVLWIVYSFQVDDWRFGAIAAIPFLFSWITRLVMPKPQAVLP